MEERNSNSRKTSLKNLNNKTPSPRKKNADGAVSGDSQGSAKSSADENGIGGGGQKSDSGGGGSSKENNGQSTSGIVAASKPIEAPGSALYSLTQYFIKCKS